MVREKKDKSNPECLMYELELWGNKIEYIAGVDECGRGPWAGNVVAAAVIMPKDVKIERLTDSKKLPKSEHKQFAELVKEKALAWCIAEASIEEIDEINIKKASQLAMKRAIEGLKIKPEYLLIDGTEVIASDIPQKSIIKGDFNSHSISAASIIAKVYRDEQMAEFDKEFDNRYGWATNAGYQSKSHVDACKKYGLTKYHRKSWKTTQQLLDGEL